VTTHKSFTQAFEVTRTPSKGPNLRYAAPKPLQMRPPTASTEMWVITSRFVVRMTRLIQSAWACLVRME
jgi:hypothetical protein